MPDFKVSEETLATIAGLKAHFDVDSDTDVLRRMIVEMQENTGNEWSRALNPRPPKSIEPEFSVAELDQLENLARAADTGPWQYSEDTTSRPGSGIPFVTGPSSNPSIPSPDVVATTRYSDRFMENDRANLRHIAACDPPTVLRLIAALRVRL